MPKLKTFLNSTIFRIPAQCNFMIGYNSYVSMNSRFFGFLMKYITSESKAVF